MSNQRQGAPIVRIVLVDDDQDTQDILVPYLTGEGFRVYGVDDGQEALESLRHFAPDLVILDVRLPSLNGWQVLRQLRSFSDVPVMMITAAAREDDDVVHGLDLGADDYLVKPFPLKVLRARVQALLRRSAWQETDWTRSTYVDHHLMIDLRREVVTVGGARVAMSSLEYRLLRLLVANVNQAVPTLEIIESLWANEADESYMSYVRIYISRLREIIEPDSRQPQYIVTEHGFGYRFVGQG